MSTQIVLPALLGSHPLGALASFGLLRLATEWDSSVKLRFVLQDDWITALESDRNSLMDDLIAMLVEWIRSDKVDNVLNWAADVRMPRQDYARLLRTALHENNLPRAEFLSAIAADGAMDQQKGLIKPGAFYMVSGQQKFLKGAQDIVALIRTDPAAMFREALEGPWAYRARTHGLGWDPNTERLYALRHRAPTSEKASCVAGAVALGLWAIPMFPSVSSKGRARTVGFTRRKSEQFFTWPVFSSPVGLGELTSLLQAGEKAWTSRDGSSRPGIEACYASRRFEFGQGYAVLRAPKLMLKKAERRLGARE